MNRVEQELFAAGSNSSSCGGVEGHALRVSARKDADTNQVGSRNPELVSSLARSNMTGSILEPGI